MTAVPAFRSSRAKGPGTPPSSTARKPSSVRPSSTANARASSASSCGSVALRAYARARRRRASVPAAGRCSRPPREARARAASRRRARHAPGSPSAPRRARRAAPRARAPRARPGNESLPGSTSVRNGCEHLGRGELGPVTAVLRRPLAQRAASMPTASATESKAGAHPSRRSGRSALASFRCVRRQRELRTCRRPRGRPCQRQRRAARHAHLDVHRPGVVAQAEQRRAGRPARDSCRPSAPRGTASCRPRRRSPSRRSRSGCPWARRRGTPTQWCPVRCRFSSSVGASSMLLTTRSGSPSSSRSPTASPRPTRATCRPRRRRAETSRKRAARR